MNICVVELIEQGRSRIILKTGRKAARHFRDPFLPRQLRTYLVRQDDQHIKSPEAYQLISPLLSTHLIAVIQIAQFAKSCVLREA